MKNIEEKKGKRKGDIDIDAYIDTDRDRDRDRDRDIWRHSALRYFGYANEVGESFRPLVPSTFVIFSYIVAFLYVG